MSQHWIAWVLVVCVGSGCQVVTKLSSFEIEEQSMDAGPELDAAKPELDAAKPELDAAKPVDSGGSRDAEPRCLIGDGAECDLVRQCGCESEQHCQVRGSTNRPTCVKPGDRPRWSACTQASECPAGQTCDRGSCRDYCAKDGDCKDGACLPSRGEDGVPRSDINVCWKSCKLQEQGTCAEGTTCRSTKNPFAETGTYCVAPYDPCPTVADGTCDEAQGTGTCAKGTDKKDCECAPKLPAAKCDPVEQCGCAADSTCEALSLKNSASIGKVASFTADCVLAGPRNLREECSDTADCRVGLQCNQSSRTCTNYCSSNADCEDGGCFKLVNDADTRLGVCVPKCSRITGKPCSGDTVCATVDAEFLTSEPGNYCFPPSAVCVTNGVCDEPRGTAMCLEGTDSADCCEPPSVDGECEPVHQCGCESKPGTQCQHVANSNVTKCVPAGEKLPEGACSDQTCGPGYYCYLGACRAYCTTAQDCGGGSNLCLQLSDGNATKLPGIGACMLACDYATNGPCAEGLQCAILGAPLAYCIRPTSQCPFIGDGKCDDNRPGGTRLCTMGSDPDCG